MRRRRVTRGARLVSILALIATLGVTIGVVLGTDAGTSRAGVAATPARRARASRAAGHDATPAVVRYRVREGSTIDLGWTGMAHRQPWPSEQRIEFTLTCGGGGGCEVGGGAEGVAFGAPIPLSTGGVPACVVNRLRAPLTGTADPTTGCGALRLALETTVYTGNDVARPCPRCDGDRAPNDGRRGGRCAGGVNSGKACDANSASALFGATSNDCPPAPASAAGTLAIDLAPLTTGEVRLTADRGCKLRRAGLVDHCFCPDQRQPNACDSGSCPVGEVCDGPVDGVCARAPFRSCLPGSEEGDCEAAFAGSGSCENRTRACFADTIAAHGTCDRAQPVYVAIFCAPATRASAINTTGGLPGPARLRLALEAVTPASARAATAR